tara:strand:- start:159 stop:1010 length:852 start_codon:yes stop_codon:yes gene_type:complete
MTIGSFHRELANRLSEKGTLDADLESEVIIRYVLGIDRSVFFRDLMRSITFHEKQSLEKIIKRRLLGEPLSYIIGTREFYSISLFVNHDVLIPRQETELLVETILSFVNENQLNNPRIVDVGTGSGAIAIALAINVPTAIIDAIDISEKALKVAKSNIDMYGLNDRVSLHRGDLLASINENDLDVIVSNPPYIPTGDMSFLQKEVLLEPRVALDGGEDGLGVISRLLWESTIKLSSNGILVFEVGSEQALAALNLAEQFFPGRPVSLLEDLSRNPRAILIGCN